LSPALMRARSRPAGLFSGTCGCYSPPHSHLGLYVSEAAVLPPALSHLVTRHVTGHRASVPALHGSPSANQGLGDTLGVGVACVAEEEVRAMFRKWRQKRNEMAAEAIEVPRGALFLQLMDDGYSPKEAGVVAKASHPFLVQAPEDRAFEDVMRQTSIAFAMQASQLSKEKGVELAVKTLDGYRHMALDAGDANYVAWFSDALDVYNREEPSTEDEVP
jgi:hypothetical protein